MWTVHLIWDFLHFSLPTSSCVGLTASCPVMSDRSEQRIATRMKNRYRKMGYRSRIGQRQQQQHQQEHNMKTRTVVFLSEDRKTNMYQWISTPLYIGSHIVFDGNWNRFVYANTHGLYPFSYEDKNYQSVFISPDHIDLAAANISWQRPAEVRSNKRNSTDNFFIFIYYYNFFLFYFRKSFIISNWK